MQETSPLHGLSGQLVPERLLRFIRMEVAMNERRQQRYSPEAVEFLFDLRSEPIP